MSELVSNCCTAPMHGAMLDMEMCPDCYEHCEVIDLDEEEE